MEGGKRVLDARKAQEGPQEDREERNNRRNKGSDGTGAASEARQNETGRGERDGDSGRGRGRANRSSGSGRGSGEGGGRGNRGGRGGGRGGKREFERKSGDDKTSGVKAVDKREGSGSHNWGTYEDDIKADQDQVNTSTDETGQTTDTPANDAAKTEATNGVAEKEEVREPEEITYTLDEWKAQQGEKKELKFNTRKA